jgi:hypothetical protein
LPAPSSAADKGDYAVEDLFQRGSFKRHNQLRHSEFNSESFLKKWDAETCRQVRHEDLAFEAASFSFSHQCTFPNCIVENIFSGWCGFRS